MSGVGAWWAVAGGWAIDLWLGTQSREHHDVEVVIRRCDQQLVLAALSDRSEVWCLDPPGSGWRTWDGHDLWPPAFQLQARANGMEFDLFTESVVDGAWTYRRDARIRRPADEVIVVTGEGIPVVRPEIQLLYMSTSGDAKNLHDFELVHTHLPSVDAAWLAQSLATARPGHPWIDALDPDEVKKRVASIRRRLRWKGPVFAISAITGAGTRELVFAIMTHIEAHRSGAGAKTTPDARGLDTGSATAGDESPAIASATNAPAASLQ